MKKYRLFFVLFGLFICYNGYSQEYETDKQLKLLNTNISDESSEKPLLTKACQSYNVEQNEIIINYQAAQSSFKVMERKDNRLSQTEPIITDYFPLKGLVDSNPERSYYSHIVLNESINSSQKTQFGDDEKDGIKEELCNKNYSKGWNLMMAEDFEGSFPNGDWSSYAPSGFTDAYWDDASCRSYNGGWSAFVADNGSQSVACGDNYLNDMKSIMQYGPFDLSDADDAYLNFQWWANTEADFDKFSVYASVDGTNFWGVYWTGAHTSWNQYTFDLTDVYTLGDLTGYSEVWIAFFYTSDGSVTESEGAYVDDVELWKNVASGTEDLQLTGGGFSPNPLTEDGTLSINAEIYNNGTAAASGSELQYYLSTNTSISPSDIYLGNDYAYINPGETGYETISVDLDYIASPGTYYVGVYFVNEDDGWYWLTPIEIITAGVQDLELSGGGFSPNPVAIDGTLAINAEIYNNGTAAASSSELQYYLSIDANIDQNDFYLGNDYVSLGPGETGNENISINLNNNYASGFYYVGVYFVDENNGWWWNSPLEIIPIEVQDLQLTGGGFSPNPIAEDGILSINAEIYNNGNATASSSELQYYLSTDMSIDQSDIYLGNDYANISPGVTGNESISVDLNSNVSPGNYYVGVYFVDENDGWYWTSPLEIIEAGIPDINVTPSSITINETGKSSENELLTEYDLKLKPINTEFIIDTIVDENGNIIYGVLVPGVLPPEVKQPIAVPGKGAVILSNVPAFSWSFGCSATAAAMAAGYFDNSGYPDMYTGPTNGGLFPMDNSSWPTVTINGESRAQCPLSATRNGLDGRTSRGHVDDYWVVYNSAQTDPWITNGWTEHTWGACTADYMGTNQSSYGNTDGGTTFYFNPSGPPLEDYTGSEPGNKDGCHGLRAFYESRGYDIITNYTQLIYGYDGNTQGYTLANFQSEIDAGRPVLIHVTGHTMLGTGYENDGSGIIYLHDTWDYSQHSMVWGESYSDMQHWGMTVVELEESSATEDFTIQNLGTSELTVSAISDNATWLTLNGIPSIPFDLSPSNSQGFGVDINWSLVGDNSQTASITIQSNDPDESSISVTVTAIPDIAEYLSVSPSNREVTSSSGSTTFSVSSNTSWTVSDNASWITVSPSSASNNGAITASFSANTGEERFGTITVNGDGVNPVSVTLTQEAAAPSPYLNVSPSSLNISSNSGNTSFNISSNTNWSISDNASWITVSPTSGSDNNNITVSYSENNGAQRSGIITVSGTGVSNQTVTVNQNAAASGTLVFVNPENQTVSTSETFSTTVEIADVINLGGFELNIDFDPAYLQASSVSLGSFLGSSGRSVFPLTNNINNTTGLIEFAATTLGASPAGPNGDGILLTIEWISAASVDDDIITYLMLEALQITEPTGTIIASAIQNGIITITSCYPYDFDCDCDVDIVDVTMAAFAYGTSSGNPNYNPKFDFDTDGDIDIIDITMVTYNYGWTCSKSSLERIDYSATDNDDAILRWSASREVQDGFYEMDLLVENIEQLGAFEFAFTYDANAIEIVDLEEGDFINTSNRKVQTIHRDIDQENGLFSLAIATLGSQLEAANGSGILATIRYQTQAAQKPELTLVQSQLVRPDAELISHTLKSGTPQLSATSIISTYPTPMVDQLVIAYQVGADSDINFRIYNVYGALLKLTEPKSTKTGIHYLSFENMNLSSGMYIITLESNGIVMDSRRLIVQ